MAGAKARSVTNDARDIARQLLAWYDISARALPWRQPPGIRSDPYRVWLSEIMLQQTTVKAVIPYYHKFLARWPSVRDLASAELDGVLAAWAGLGYYSRARNLHGCARAIVLGHGGRFPQSETELLNLPGIGAYTAAAIAAIVFDQPAVAVDGNVERVVARLFAVGDPLPGAKTEIKRLAGALVPPERPGDFTQAMMDLGATICSPRSPSCAICPVIDHCQGRRLGVADLLPRKTPKKARPTRHCIAFVAVRKDGAVLLRRRPPKGLLGGMLEVPSSDWLDEPVGFQRALEASPLPAEWRPVARTVGHTFTHFHLELAVYIGRVEDGTGPPIGCRWHMPEELPDAALPSVMRKVLAHALGADHAAQRRQMPESHR